MDSKTLTVPRKQVLLCALNSSVIKTRSGDKVYRIDPHDALERMVNGFDTYELTTVTVEFSGSVNLSDAQISARLSPRPK